FRKNWRKRVGVEPTIAAERRRSPVLKTGRITGPLALPTEFGAAYTAICKFIRNIAPSTISGLDFVRWKRARSERHRLRRSSISNSPSCIPALNARRLSRPPGSVELSAGEEAMTRFASILFVIALCIALIGCGGSNDSSMSGGGDGGGGGPI